MAPRGQDMARPYSGVRPSGGENWSPERDGGDKTEARQLVLPSLMKVQFQDPLCLMMRAIVLMAAAGLVPAAAMIHGVNSWSAGARIGREQTGMGWISIPISISTLLCEWCMRGQQGSPDGRRERIRCFGIDPFTSRRRFFMNDPG